MTEKPELVVFSKLDLVPEEERAKLVEAVVCAAKKISLKLGTAQGAERRDA